MKPKLRWITPAALCKGEQCGRNGGQARLWPGQRSRLCSDRRAQSEARSRPAGLLQVGQTYHDPDEEPLGSERVERSLERQVNTLRLLYMLVPEANTLFIMYPKLTRKISLFLLLSWHQYCEFIQSLYWEISLSLSVCPQLWRVEESQ